MNKLILSACLIIASVVGSQATAVSYADDAKAKALIKQLQKKHDMDPAWVRQQLAAAERQPEILEAMRTPPEETLAWHEYREIFLGKQRIQGGADFIRQHADIFQRVEKHYGVPRAIIAAIIGVETLYGQVLGDQRVLDALATLGFDYPPRADFFRSELGQFLVLARHENINPQRVKGSYAGAMGLPQFIPSSYRAYAVDFNSNGQRDLWDEPADIIGSVGHYLAKNGWERGEPIIFRSQAESVAKHLEFSRRSTRYKYRDLVLAGIKATSQQELTPETDVGLVKLEGKQGPQYWIGLKNFFVITDYNHSKLYAMAVYQLSQAIKEQLKTAQAMNKP